MYEVHRIDAYTDLSVNVTVRSGVKETHSSTLYWQVVHGCWSAPAMVVEGIGLHIEDILVSLVLSIIKRAVTATPSTAFDNYYGLMRNFLF